MADTDPYRSYNFKLQINGFNQGHFTECSGLGIKIEPIKYREAGDHQVVRHVPGQVDYSPITLRYGLSDSADLWEWLMAGVTGKVIRRNISVILLDSEGDSEVDRWDLNDAWPSEWRGSVLNALSREIAIESMTLVYDSISRGKQSGSPPPAPTEPTK